MNTTPSTLPGAPNGSVRHPYLWVIMWVILLVIIGAVFWYFFVRQASEGPSYDEIINSSSASKNAERLSPAERQEIVDRSSAVPGAQSTLSAEMRARIRESSSASTVTGGRADNRLSPAQREAILRASSAR